MINSPRIEKKINGLNRIGLKALIKREVFRFINVYTQTIIAPVITTLMFYTVFALAFGGEDRMIGDLPFLAFLAPGLVMMTMLQNSFANTSSSLVISKVQGNIVDVLMPPLSAMELFLGYATGAVLRGLIVGLITTIVLTFFAPIQVYSFWPIFVFAFLGTLMLGTIGLAAGIWSEKFDHIAAVTNFVVTPMTFLSGTFYSLSQLPEFWQKLALANPFFYIIDGFRYGFIGQADGNIYTGILILSLCNILLIGLAYSMIKTGYKIKS